MKRLSLLSVFMLMTLFVSSQTPFVYNDSRLQSSPRNLYVNPSYKSNPSKYTFASAKEALRYAERYANDTLCTNIYIEPYVYWLDDPDDPQVRRPEEGSNTPFGMKLKLSRTRIIGLSANAEDVVLACNRGQTQGADGNFTMIHITGDEIEAKNITFGNYCNVDLNYARNPRLSRPKRKDAIVQAQLVICNGDNYRLENCRFISRLNLCPFVGAKHADFHNCYFECTDDALCGTGTYRQCRFTFYSGKPFYTTERQGATFIDCDIHSKVRGTQYLTKVSGPVSMTDCRWTSDDPNLRIEWTKRPDPRHYCVMKNCTLNGNPLDVPTPTEPLPTELPPFSLAVQPDVTPGAWTIDSYKPSDTMNYQWQPDNNRSSWGYAEGVDGAEGIYGLVQLQRGARIMFTPKNENEAVSSQACIIKLDPCKSAGQGFGSATGQYLDVCIKFDTRRLTGYGIRFVRTPEYDRAVEVYLVEYSNGIISRLTTPQRCDLFRAGCKLLLKADGDVIKAEISNSRFENIPPQTLQAVMPHPNAFGGFHLQHTGTVGASATVIESIFLK